MAVVVADFAHPDKLKREIADQGMRLI